MSRPMLRIKRLSVRGLGPIERLDLPEDGLGWGDEIPRMVLLGGPNGGGKTTLLNFIEAAMRTLAITDDNCDAVPEFLRTAGEEAWFDIEVTDGHADAAQERRFGLSAELPRGQNFGVKITAEGRFVLDYGNIPPDWLAGTAQPYADSDWPGVLHLPSEDRELVVMPHRVEPPGPLQPQDEFVYRWERPEGWQDTLQSALQMAQWADFLARDTDRPGDHFARYAEDLRWFTGASKELFWTDEGELRVRLANGEEHGLDALSSGEKQVLLLTGEIRRRMRPGSLLLIDEPDLHLHPHWETKLYERMLRLVEEGDAGQVIMATQSNHLFRIAEPGTAALIGRSAF